MLEEIGAGAAPRIMVMNKIDLMYDGMRPHVEHDAVAISARTGDGLEELLAAVARFFATSREEVSVTLEATRGDLVAMARRDGQVLSEEYEDGRVAMRALVSAAVAGRLRKAALTLGSKREKRTMATPMNVQPQNKATAAPTLVRVPLRDLLNLPNSLTLLRLFSIPVFLGLLGYHHYRAALWVFGLAALTDSLDGTVARWFDAKTELGSFLDPFADKLMLVSAFVVLTMDGDFPPWLFGIVIIRDVIIVFGYFLVVFLTGERIPVRPSYIGKGSTFFQLACVVAALARLNVIRPEYFNYLLYSAAGFTALSGVHYMYRGLEILFYREPGMFE